MESLIGTIAATLTTISFLPQVIKILKTKKTEDISLMMYVTFTTGVGFWLAYGILLGSLPMMIANSITLCLASTILAIKIKNKT